MLVLSETVIIQVKDVTILSAAKKYVRCWSVLRLSPSKAAIIGYEAKKPGSQPSTPCWAPSSARSVMMQMPTIRMTASTKYAWPVLEPVKRDLRPAPPGRFSCRITIRVTMPSTVIRPRNSVKISYGSQSPMIGISQSAWKS